MPIRDGLPSHVTSALTDYRTITSLPVQWGNMDAFGHVNNVVYVQWFESARIDLLDSWTSDVTMDGKGIGPILASIKCDYKRQLHFPDTVHIGSRTARMGRSSVDIEHAVYSEHQQKTVALGTSVMVVFDYAANRPVRIPENLRQQIQGNAG